MTQPYQQQNYEKSFGVTSPKSVLEAWFREGTLKIKVSLHIPSLLRWRSTKRGQIDRDSETPVATTLHFRWCFIRLFFASNTNYFFTVGEQLRVEERRKEENHVEPPDTGWVTSVIYWHSSWKNVSWHLLHQGMKTGRSSLQTLKNLSVYTCMISVEVKVYQEQNSSCSFFWYEIYCVSNIFLNV